MTSEPISGTKEGPTDGDAAGATRATPDGPEGLEFTVVVATREGTGGVEFLMVRHRERGWELPGGKVEGKEGPVHCALREFREETGHLLSEPRFVMKVRKPEATCFVFTGGVGTRVQAGGDSDRDEAVQETKWFRRLPKADLAFPDDPYDEIGQALRIAFR